MNTLNHTIINTTVSGTNFGTAQLSADEVHNAMITHPGSTEAALRAATRAGLFNPVVAGPSDTVAVEVKQDGSAEIVVVSRIPPTTTTVVTMSNNASM